MENWVNGPKGLRQFEFNCDRIDDSLDGERANILDSQFFRRLPGL